MKILSTSLLFLAALALPVSSLFADSVKFTATSARDIIQYDGTVNLSELAKATAAEASNAGSSASVVAKPTREAPPMRHPPFANAGQRVIQHNAATPRANDASQNATVTPLFRGFTGLRELDQAAASPQGGLPTQFILEPPDQGLAVGSQDSTGASFVVEIINDALDVYNTNGFVRLLAPVANNKFFGLKPEVNPATGKFGPFLADPTAVFDPETGRWFICELELGVNANTGNFNNTSKLHLAVSQNSDPTQAYFLYSITTTNSPARFPDYPKLGVDHNGVFISGNEFQFSNGNFLGAVIYAVSKMTVENGPSNPALTATRISLPFNTGYEFTVLPQLAPPGTAYLTSNGGTMYFASSNAAFNTACSLAVWALTNTSSLNGTPALSVKMATVNTQCYNEPSQGVLQAPGFIPQGLADGAPEGTIDPGDTRMGGQNMVFTNSQLMCTLATEVTDSNSNQVMAAAWFVLHPTFSGGTLSATLTTQGIISLNGASFLRPAFVMNTQLFGAIVGTQVGPSDFPSSAFVGFNGFTPGSVTISRAGTEPDDGFTCYPGAQTAPFNTGRWGDYSAAVVDSDNSIWLGTEYIPDIFRDDFANWCTYITRVQLNH